MVDNVNTVAALDAFVSDVKQSVARCVMRTARRIQWVQSLEQILPGKMLRSRLAGRLAEAGLVQNLPGLRDVCAAVEMAHTASLCHDDLVDGAPLRRGRRSLWRVTSPSAAVLIGDLLLCEAVELLRTLGDGEPLREFLAKIREVLEAEAEQELLLRGTPVSHETCLRLARGKTGPLFAFAAMACGGDDPGRCSALEDAGYRIGTLYQLADDLVDVVGSETVAGKTLGTDVARGKFTLAQPEVAGPDTIQEHIRDLCQSAQHSLAPFPTLQSLLQQFLRHDLQPALDRHPNIHVELGV